MFNLNDVDVSSGALQPGDYSVKVDKLEWKTSKGGDDYLNLQLRVVGEKAKNAVIFDMLHLFNKNETARKIAQQTLKKICLACDLPMEFDSKEALTTALYGKVLTVRTKVEEDDFGEKAKVVNYKKLEGEVSAESMAPTVDPTEIPF